MDPAQVQRYRDGELGIRELAAAVGCSVRQARVLLSDAGVDVRADDDERLHREIVTRYTTQERSIRAIAEEIVRSYGYVHRRLTDAEVPLRSRGGPRPQRRTSGDTTRPVFDASPLIFQGGTTDDFP